LKLGELEFHVISAGHLLLDGGAMFGVIPRPMWEKKMPPDSRNRITLSMNCLVIRANGKRILVETGAGDKLSPKLREIFGLDGPFLLDGLRALDLRPEDIDIVVNTHLHFDHCGGNTRIELDQVVPAFPNARYWVQEGELDHAMRPTERDKASYFQENFAPIGATGQLSIIEGEHVLTPGVELIRVPGHTGHMQCVRLSSRGKSAFFFADLVPMVPHLAYPWIMGFDLYPLTTLEHKKKWIPRVAHEGSLALFAHETHTPAGYLRERDGKFIVEAVQLTEGGRV